MHRTFEDQRTFRFMRKLWDSKKSSMTVCIWCLDHLVIINKSSLWMLTQTHTVCDPGGYLKCIKAKAYYMYIWLYDYSIFIEKDYNKHIWYIVMYSKKEIILCIYERSRTNTRIAFPQPVLQRCRTKGKLLFCP